MHVDKRLAHGFRNLLQVSFGQDGFRCEAVGPDSKRAGLQGEVSREQLDSRLGGSVRDGRSIRSMAGGGRNGDDVAALSCFIPATRS